MNAVGPGSKINAKSNFIRGRMQFGLIEPLIHLFDLFLLFRLCRLHGFNFFLEFLHLLGHGLKLFFKRLDVVFSKNRGCRKQRQQKEQTKDSCNKPFLKSFVLFQFILLFKMLN